MAQRKGIISKSIIIVFHYIVNEMQFHTLSTYVYGVVCMHVCVRACVRAHKFATENEVI